MFNKVTVKINPRRITKRGTSTSTFQANVFGYHGYSRCSFNVSRWIICIRLKSRKFFTTSQWNLHAPNEPGLRPLVKNICQMLAFNSSCPSSSLQLFQRWKKLIFFWGIKQNFPKCKFKEYWCRIRRWTQFLDHVLTIFYGMDLLLNVRSKWMPAKVRFRSWTLDQ